MYKYDKSIELVQNVPKVTGATAYDDPTTGKVIILFINEGLYYGEKLDHTLINPDEVREYGIPVWDNLHNRSNPLGIEIDADLFIPFTIKGTNISF